MNRHLGICFWSLIFSFSFFGVFFTSRASAETLLIDCDLHIGPYYQVHVLSQSDGLKLREFKRNGEIIQRELMPWEWTNKRMKLTTGRLAEKVEIQKRSPAWLLKIETPSMKYEGLADCDQY